MPIFVDLHPPTEVPMQAVRRGIADARHGVEDGQHVRQVDFFCCEEGAVYCVLQAPGPEAVRRRHAERGMPCREVWLVEGMQGHLPLSPADRRVLSQALVRDWEARHPAA